MHDLNVDSAGNLWITDCKDNRSGRLRRALTPDR